MDFETTLSARLTQPAKLSAQTRSKKVIPLFKLGATGALLVLLYLVFLH